MKARGANVTLAESHSRWKSMTQPTSRSKGRNARKGDYFVLLNNGYFYAFLSFVPDLKTFTGVTDMATEQAVNTLYNTNITHVLSTRRTLEGVDTRPSTSARASVPSP